VDVYLLGRQLDFESFVEVLKGGMQLSTSLVEAPQVVERHRPQFQPHLLRVRGLEGIFEGLRG
jgi:hypothetical protein